MWKRKDGKCRQKGRYIFSSSFHYLLSLKWITEANVETTFLLIHILSEDPFRSQSQLNFARIVESWSFEG